MVDPNDGLNVDITPGDGSPRNFSFPETAEASPESPLVSLAERVVDFTKSAVGKNLTEIEPWQITLPDYLKRLMDGIFVDLQAFPDQAVFREFVETRVFLSGKHFVGLDYPLLQDLLYGDDRRF